MSTQIAISLDNELLRKLDGLVEKEVFPSLDIAIQLAVKEKLARLEQDRSAGECSKLELGSEQAVNLTPIEALDALQIRLQVDANKAAKWMEAVREGRR
jgi:hypothetical protein